MPLIKGMPGLLPFRWRRGHIKHQEQNIKQLEMKLKLLYYKRDALKEEIMKELVRGEMPSREFRIWLDKGERIEHQFNKILKAQTKGSVLNVPANSEKLGHLMSMLEYEIVKYLEVSPFDQVPCSNSPHKIMKLPTRSKMGRSIKKFRRVKPLAKAEENAEAKPEGVAMPFKIVVRDDLIRQLKNKATAEPELKGVNNEMVTKLTLSSSPSKEVPKGDSDTQAKGIVATAEVESKQANTEIRSSSSNLNREVAELDLVSSAKRWELAAEAESKEVKHAITTEAIATSSSGIQATEADLDTSATNMATAEPVSMEVKTERSSESSLPSFLKAAEKVQPLHILKVESNIAEMRHQLVSPEPRLKTKKSIQNMVQKIIRSKAKIIGLYGQGGIGKTSILRALIDDPKVKQKFDPIIWVTVSRCWSTSKIQEEVVRQLPFYKVDNRPGSNIATSLSQALEKKKFLLILDDVWEKIDLNEVGIPCSSLGNGCRLIMTTRSVDLCCDMATKEIQVGYLSSEESWELFCEQIGQIVHSPNIEPYARGIVNECGGLPLSIIVVGKALSGETDVSEWKLALKYFLLPKNGEHGVEPLVQKLKFSYERLTVYARKNPKLMGSDLQICFLYCARFPEDYEVDVSNLVEYWIQEGLITGNLVDSHKKGHDIVEILKDAALLESTRDGACVRMHGLIRDLASGLTSAKVRQFTIQESNPLLSHERMEDCDPLSPEGHEHLFRAGAGLTEPPPEKEWEVAKIISLEDNDLSSLPAIPNCPKLLTFNLQRNPRLRVLPVSFFDQMPHLKVLNLSKTRITTLPRSIENLQNLIQLNLRDCERLTSLPPKVGKLKRIELLDLHGTVLNKLPEAVGELEFLKDLEVSFYGPVDQREYSKLPSELIPSGILSKLHHLNNLSIVVKPGDLRWNDLAESIITDMCDLSNLTSLRFYFPELRHLLLFKQSNNSWKNNSLKKFSFIVGYDNKRMLSRVPHDVELDYNQHDRCLRLVNEKLPPQEAIKQVLTHTTSFYLDHHLNISSLSRLGARNIIGLEFCVVRECPEIEYITNGKELALPFLEHLSLHYLEKLKGIWNGKIRLQYGSFASLKCLLVCTCRQLEYVFTSSMCQSVPNLEELVVEDCEAIKNVIFVWNPVNPDLVMLPKLKKLRQRYLPNLVNIWKGTSWPSLEDISFYCCPKLKNLDMGSGSVLKVSIREIKAEKEWWDLLDWDDTSLYSSFVHRNICKWM